MTKIETAQKKSNKKPQSDDSNPEELMKIETAQKRAQKISQATSFASAKCLSRRGDIFALFLN